MLPLTVPDLHTPSGAIRCGTRKFPTHLALCDSPCN
jgi:hypothetical protein